MKHHKAKADFAIVEKARDMREFDSMELKDIAKELGISYWTVVDWCFYRTRYNA